jgi:predicted RNA-binding protein YlxR (DUF448 family)
MRTCVGCRTRAPAADLRRVRRAPDGTVEVGDGPGRGAWLCAPPRGLECLDDALRRGALTRALRVRIPDATAAGLRARLEGRRDA